MCTECGDCTERSCGNDKARGLEVPFGQSDTTADGAVRLRGRHSHGHSPREDNNSSFSTPIRGDAVSHTSNTGVTETVTSSMSVASIPCYTSVTPVSLGIVLSQENLSGQNQVSHASVSQAVIPLGQIKGALSCGEPLYRGSSILKVSEASLPQMRSSNEGRESPGTQGHSSFLAGQLKYHWSHSGSEVAPSMTKVPGNVL